MKQHFYQSFILPFRSRARLQMFAAQLLGAVAVGFLAVFVTLDIAQLGVDSMVTYTIVRFGLAGFVGFPFLTALYLFAPRFVFRSVILVLQCCGIVPLLFSSQFSPLMIGCCMGVCSAAYWQVFHLAMTAQTSDAGRGYEVSLSQILMTMGAAAGSLLGGFAAAAGLSITIAVYAFALQIIASIMFCLLIPRVQRHGEGVLEGQVSVLKMGHEIMHNPLRTALTVAEASYSLLGEILRPAWLKVMGVAALGVGVVSALIIIIQALVAPWAGKFYAQNKMAEMRWGSAVLCCAWLPWVWSAQTMLLFFSVPLWSAGAMLLQTGLGGRWYKDRSATAILIREVLLTIARIAIACWGIPLMFNTPALFSGVIVLVALVLLGLSFWRFKPTQA